LKDLEQKHRLILTKKEAALRRRTEITPSLRWYKTMGFTFAVIIDQKREMTAIRMSEIRIPIVSI
jgi:hypothetical protein